MEQQGPKPISKEFQAEVRKAIEKGLALPAVFALDKLYKAGQVLGIDPFADLKADTRFMRHIKLHREQEKYAVFAARRVAYNLITTSRMPGVKEVRYLWDHVQEPKLRIIPELQRFHVAPDQLEFATKLVEARIREEL